VDSELWFALFQLFKMGGHKRQIFLGTNDFGKIIGTSQQTASRRLLELMSVGYVTRELTTKGQNIAITERGVATLKDVYHALKIGFEEAAHIIFLNGVVFSGFGEGAYYVTKSGYKDQFVEKLGFKPYPGTLNLRLRSITDIKARKDLEALPSIVVKGFINGERTYGDVKCFKLLINEKTEGAILMIHRTHYGQDVLEVVAEESLRKKLKLKDGDLVRLKILL
jgi:riboflavin kinase